MRYLKQLTEYALQQRGKPATAMELVDDVMALAIDAGASAKVVDLINAKRLSGNLRSLVERGSVQEKGRVRDETHRRDVPCYVPARNAERVPEPTAPPGIPAVMRNIPAPPLANARAHAAMEELFQQVGTEAITTLGQIEAQIRELVERYQRRFQELREAAR